LLADDGDFEYESAAICLVDRLKIALLPALQITVTEGQAGVRNTTLELRWSSERSLDLDCSTGEAGNRITLEVRQGRGDRTQIVPKW
jgi:hypothetical protein